MILHAPQIILLLIVGAELGYTFANHGEPKRDPYYNFGITLTSMLIFIGILYWGGFFG